MDNKTDLSDVTFLILVRLDSIDRLENILATSQFLCSNFKTNIWVSEYATYNNDLLGKLLDENISYSFTEDHDPILYRTKFLNQMIGVVDKPIVCVWDTDVIVPAAQIVMAVGLLRTGEADIVYPYESHFYDTSPLLRKLYLKERKIELLEQNTKKMKEMYLPNPLGGAFLANLLAYKESGMENESFYGWGMEDGERIARWRNMNYKIHRVTGSLFHLSHERGVNSNFHSNDQGLFKKKEYRSVRRNTTISRLQSNDAK